MSIGEEIAQRVDKALDGDCGYGVGEYLAAAVMPLVKRAQAGAWIEGHAQALANVAWPHERKGNPYADSEDSGV